MGNKDKGKREKKKAPQPKSPAPKREEFTQTPVRIAREVSGA
jgi:hypothetical protein